jgi:hypothetical protein
MKRFLMSNHNNKKWIEAQENTREAQSNVETVSQLVRREMFPQLNTETLNSSIQTGSCTPNGLLIEARQRQLHRKAMNELYARRNFVVNVKQSSAIYRRYINQHYLHTWLNLKKMEFTSPCC